MQEGSKVYSQKEFEEKLKSELGDKELTIMAQRDKISDLKREIIKLSKEREEIDEREAQISETINKYKTRAQYLENIIKMRLELEISRIEAVFDEINANFADFDKFGKAQFEAAIKSIKALKDDATEVKEISKLNNGGNQEKDDFSSLEERYFKLLSIYELGKAEVGDKRRGRPKKEAPTIEGYLKHKKQESDRKKREQFDIDEALNPVDSLENILKDLK